MALNSFDPTGLPEFTAIRTFEHHESLSSTSDRVKVLLKPPGPPKLPCLVVARRQTAGRGRAGKSWWSGDGALMMSLGFELDALRLNRGELPLLSLGTALAVLETISDEYAAKWEVGLHWPNDVYVDGKKISGILLEAPTPNHVVVGIGVNVNNRFSGVSPEHFGRPPVSLIDLTGEETDLSVFLRRFLVRLHKSIERLSIDRDGFINEVERRCVQTGRRITVDGRHGRCLGLTPDGGLRLETSSGIETIHGGIVRNA